MKNITGLWVNLSRAYEIALLGNFTIQIIFEKKYKQGFEDYENIKKYYNNVSFVKDGNLIIEIFKPDFEQSDRVKFETLEDIHNRIENAKKNIKPTIFKTSACDGLLKTATERLCFSINRRDNIIKIAKIIAQLDNSETIEVIHIAEAIQYNVKNDFAFEYCNAENKTINFGNGIEISLYELDNDCIKNAIKYLSNLINN